MSMIEKIQQYIASKELAWAPTTLRSEASRLSALSCILETANPDALWRALADKGSYTRATTWTRVCDFYQWLVEEGHVSGGNPYQAWREKHARQFKHAYSRKLPTLSFSEAVALIETIPAASVRERAHRLLRGGLRFAESGQSTAGEVVGKGGKRRKTFVPGPGQDAGVSYFKVYRALKKVGLTPHMLRKICMTELARKGLQAPELCEVAGWTSFATAASYIAASRENIKKAMGELGE